MDVEATIGHFNLIIVDSLVMKKESRIGHLNFIKGGFDVLMDEKSSIHNLNKISSIAVLYESVCLHLRRNARIGVSHLLDLTSSITIGENSICWQVPILKYGHIAFISKKRVWGM